VHDTPNQAGAKGASVRVAQVLDSLAMGGAEQLAVRIANGRAAAGHPSFLYVMNADGPLRDRVDPAVELHFLDVRRSSIANPLAFVNSLVSGRKKLIQRIEADGVDVVQTHLPNPNYWGLLLELTSACRAVPTIHNNQEFSYGSRGLRSKLNLLAYRLMIRKCGAVVGCSEEVRQSLLEVLGTAAQDAAALHAVPNGVDVPEPVAAAKLDGIRARYGVSPETTLVLTAGRLTDQKDFKTLIAAVPQLVERGGDFKVVIGGDGELRQDLESQVRDLDVGDQVLLPGNILDLPVLMQAADIFVLPSKYEGLPLVLLEAMSCGLPVVGSRIKGMKDVVAEGDNALLFEVGQVDQLADALFRLMINPEERQSFGRRSWVLAETNFSFSGVLEKLDRIYGSITEINLGKG